jgi:hypothetical protein
MFKELLTKSVRVEPVQALSQNDVQNQPIANGLRQAQPAQRNDSVFPSVLCLNRNQRVIKAVISAQAGIQAQLAPIAIEAVPRFPPARE